MIEIKRSTIGTVLMVLLVLVHLSAIWNAFAIINSLLGWVAHPWGLVADLLQFLVLLLYLTMLFVALKTTLSRLLCASLVAISLVLNQFAFLWELEWGEIAEIMVRNLTLLDLLVIVVLCFKITNKANKLLPFYGVETTNF